MLTSSVGHTHRHDESAQICHRVQFAINGQSMQDIRAVNAGCFIGVLQRTVTLRYNEEAEWVKMLNGLGISQWSPSGS